MESDDNTGGSSSSSHQLKVGLVVTVLILLVFAGILMELLSLKRIRLQKINRNFCIKKDCIQQAMNMQENADKSIDPCKHFFNFTCGNYKSNSLGIANFLEKALVSRYLKSEDMLLNNTVKFILPAENLKTFYNACVNLESDNRNYQKGLKNILIQLEWPPVTKIWDSHISERFSWLDLEAKLIEMGLTNSLLQFTSEINLLDKREILLLNCAPSLLSPSDILNSEKKINNFIRLVRSFIKFINGEEHLANEIVGMFYKIEKIKMGITSKRMVFRDSSSFRSLDGVDIVTLEELDKRWKINFSKFCISLFPSYMNITKNTYIQVTSNCPSRLVNFLTQSSKRPVAGYMLWEAARNLLWIISNKTRNIDRQYKLLLQDTSAQIMSSTCQNFNIKFLPELWSYMYVKTFYSKARKDKMVKMLNLILDEAKALIKNSWLTDPSKKIAHNKLSKVKYMVDHDEEFVTDKYIQSTFENLKFDTSDMMKSVMNIQAHSFKRQWKVFLLNFRRRSIFRTPASEINAYNDLLANILLFPAAVITGMLYSDDFEGYLNFGGLGSVFGHEILHSLDTTGLEVDDEFNNRYWINLEKEKPVFENRSRCFVNQYNNYNLTSKFHVDGQATMNENLADSGVLLAYRAYLKWLQKNKVRKLPGFHKYNERQLFWITFGNIWCEKYDEKYLENVYYANDSHNIGKFRVLGTLSNFEEFANDFHCPPNSDMNPRNKCKWLN